jgi:hypothetical protein
MDKDRYSEAKEDFNRMFQQTNKPNRVDHFKSGLESARDDQLPLMYPSTNVPEYTDGYDYGRYQG